MRKLLLAMLLLFMSMACIGQAQTGQVAYEYWLDVPTIYVQTLLDHPAYIADLPDGGKTLYVLEGQRDWADNYGARIAGYIVPPRNGTYTFWVSSDDQGQLFLSSDDNPDNLSTDPIAQVLTNVAESPPSWNEFPEQQSDPVELMAGKHYYFVAFSKEGGGNDSFHIGWKGPGITQDPMPPIPGVYLAESHRLAARNQVPAHRQGGGDSEDVLVGADLMWDAPPIPDPNLKEPIFDVFIGTEPNLPQMDQIGDGITDTTVDPGELAYGTRYYWRVRVRDNAEVDPGTGEPVIVCNGLYHWFETEQATPVITEQPSDQSVFPGETATFMVAAESSSGLTYAWFETGDPTNAIGFDAILDIDNAQTDGSYYCEVTNDGGTTTTDTVQLFIRKLMAHYPLDGNSNDISGNDIHGTEIGTPAYGRGVQDESDTEAMVFDGTDDHIDLPDGFDDYSNGLTVSLWAKPASNANYQRFFDFGNGAANDNILLCRRGTSATLQFEIYNGGSSTGTVLADNAIDLDEWQLFTVTVDSLGNTVIYKNGASIQTGSLALPNVITRVNNYIGKSNWDADALYNGSLDDVRFYNYALSPIEVAELYTEVVTDAVICVERPQFDLTGPDGIPDCKVNMADFAVIAENWMECGRVPECIQ